MRTPIFAEGAGCLIRRGYSLYGIVMVGGLFLWLTLRYGTGYQTV